MWGFEPHSAHERINLSHFCFSQQVNLESLRSSLFYGTPLNDRHPEVTYCFLNYVFRSLTIRFKKIRAHSVLSSHYQLKGERPCC